MQGSRVGPYLLLAEIGSGGMGTVYLAHDEEEDRPVAVKVLHARLSERDGFFRRFQREAEAGMRVEDEHVVRTLDFGLQVADERTLCYLVTEFVEGRTLRGLLAELGSVPEALVREIARQVAAGLAAIHAAGIVHRDVKPDNVLITGEERVRIMDLGVAKVLDATQALTGEGQFAGSLAYAAPEQFGSSGPVAGGMAGPQGAGGARGSPVDSRADLYSLGVMLHELVTGRNPLARESSAATVRAQLEEVPPDLAEVAPDVSPLFAELVATLVAKRVDDRPPNAAAVLEVLDEGERSAWWASRREDRRRRTSAIPRVPVRRETALHGREGDLALLAGLWEKARAGGGGTVLLEGEAGIGKSRLVDAFLGTLGAGAQALYGSYAPAGGLGGLSDAVVQRFGATRLEAALAPYLAATPALVPAFAALLRDEPPPASAIALPGDVLPAVFVHLLRGLAAERPLVWIVEDVHFASVDARRIVLSLARAVEGHRALLVLTSRPPVPERELAALAAVATFRRTQLARLGADDVTRLLREAFRSERLVEKLAPRIAERSDGVPFFVFETIQGLKAGQFVTQLPDGTWVESKMIDRIEVPAAVRDLIGVRLSRVPTEVREVLDVASAQGFEFDPDLAAAALGRSPLAVLQGLARLERRSGVVRAVDRRYRFDHHQIQEVVYAGLAPRLREEYHAAIADALERTRGAVDADPATLDGALCVDLAEHLLKSGRGERALRYLDAALTHLGKNYLNERALALADRALGTDGLLAGAERAKLLVRLTASGGPIDLLGLRARQEAAAQEAESLAEAAGEGAVRSSAASILGTVLWQTSRYGEAEAVHRRALELARTRGDKKAEAVATACLGNVSKARGRLEEAWEYGRRHLALSREIGDRAGEAIAAGNLGNVLRAQGRLAEASEHHERNLAIARELGDRRGEAVAIGNLGTVLYFQGRIDEAREHFERGLALSRSTGDRQDEVRAIGNVGAMLCAQGHLGEARQQIERSLALSREIGDRQNEAQATSNLATILSLHGHMAEARLHAERHLALSREIGFRQGEVHALQNLGVLQWELGDAVGSEAHLMESLALSERIGHRHLSAGTQVALGALRAEAGDEAGAREALTAARDLAEAIGAPNLATIARCHLAVLPGGDAQEALRSFESSGAHLDDAERREARLLLWKATGEHAHLAEAKRLLDLLVEQAPPDCREAMLANVRLHREIAAAAKAQGL